MDYFGPHGLNKNTPPYSQYQNNQKKIFNKINKKIKLFAGGKNFTNYTRLHHYSESFELSKYFRNKGFKGLFSTDRKVGSHRMPKKISNQLLNYGYANYKKLNFIRTDFRVEWLINKRKSKIQKNFKKIQNNKNFIILYSHEYEFKKKKVKFKLFQSCEILTKN